MPTPFHACATSAPENMALRPATAPVRLVVENRSFTDVRIYAIQNNASPFPLSRVEALSTRHVVLPPLLVAARNIRLVAVPLALGRETFADHPAVRRRQPDLVSAERACVLAARQAIGKS